ncbi:KUP/HAK/KT family potassium transporter [Cytophaga hutchinsonii]|jgi:KUP system potassium uptake protein|uniref:Probable potassium transport system protein Kup n=1 Tax=Cytophaga hutchinsonii (strain ATCC 33406 / DSM 1761 / CIP 103989 / NBRC 15051 / NCIMB 9469 / D465) TaxID=269798 RepID=KUP_CYTH3|nr:KUP/HAK/KT family potassium transporter [Cytophaga hutchinsonii]Q11PK1.1 RecName: Full=Probable potassium transport system protein Kup [Cytophaga hutchinsonii ATCC 33406]ABG60662.1 low affinity potassium transport system [Cytophaga hutchinsonii ATCC 33406]SFY01491.1 KUP system potassium uptake protein [Cytophaga hutchinsonii ATCC 33406]
MSTIADSKNHGHQKLTAAGLLISLGIIYGDIGTSPLYVMKAIAGGNVISENLILGGLSCVFWTITLQTTIKYVIITLRADNKGEGGIFSLFALIRRRNPNLVWPAMIGGAAMLADGIITPPISVSSAVEGLLIFNKDIPTIPIVLAIIVMLFMIQRFGTNIVGKFFGPIMFIWFAMLATLGLSQLMGNFYVLKAINPMYAFNLLTQYTTVDDKSGFWLLGAVFLCTTGAEALYSDLGHCGRPNIRISWIFVKLALLINYFGQGAWILQNKGYVIKGNPFFGIMPEWFIVYGIIIATMAAIIASQAMISGSYTLISEALRLNLWPKVRVKYPSVKKGQLFIPSINLLLLAGCIFVVLWFGESSAMEGAYGLAINITFLMTTILLAYYLLIIKRISFIWVGLLILMYLIIEVSFLVANLEKFFHGGYFTLISSGILAFIMIIWYTAHRIKRRLTEYVKIQDYFPLIKELSEDTSIPKYSTHLIYLTGADNYTQIESKVIYSIFQKQPKRADIYWFLHIDVVDEPYTMEYKVRTMLADDVIRIDFKLGFRVEHRINLFFRKVVEDMVNNKEVDFTSRYTSLNKRNVIGDFRFVVLEKHLSNDNDLSVMEQFAMDWYFFLKHISISESSAFGLDTSSVTVEKVPMVISPMEAFQLKRVY